MNHCPFVPVSTMPLIMARFALTSHGRYGAFFRKLADHSIPLCWLRFRPAALSVNGRYMTWISSAYIIECIREWLLFKGHAVCMKSLLNCELKGLFVFFFYFFFYNKSTIFFSKSSIGYKLIRFCEHSENIRCSNFCINISKCLLQVVLFSIGCVF